MTTAFQTGYAAAESEHVASQFEPRLASWLIGAQAKIDDNYQQYTNLIEAGILPPKLVTKRGGRYIKIVRQEHRNGKYEDSSVHCFIDQNGDVLKAASWKSPAKHARGNILNPDNGLECMGPHGAAYL